MTTQDTLIQRLEERRDWRILETRMEARGLLHEAAAALRASTQRLERVREYVIHDLEVSNDVTTEVLRLLDEEAEEPTG